MAPGDEQCALRMCENGGEFRTYEAVHVVRSAKSERAKWMLAAAVVVMCAVAATVLISMNKDEAGDSALATLRIGAPAKIAHGVQSLQAAPPGVLTPPPPGGYNIFDPHYSEDGVPIGMTGGTSANVFTGHSRGSAGGPLTFGPNTYFNVFDPNGAPDMGPCDPGYTGQAGTATQKRDCHECTAGKWCPGGADGLEQDCPPKATSFTGSYKLDQCTCQGGWYGVPHFSTDKSHGCQMCLADTYCPGGRQQFACPAHSSSLDEAWYCSCDAGYYGVTHNDCKLCDANYYCPGGDPEGQEQHACALNSNSPAGSDSGTDCQCNAGYYEPTALVADTAESTDFARACGPNKDGPCPTSQSSTTHGGDSARADNNAGLDGNWNSASCTHTDSENSPWWRVDMEQPIQVASLSIVGRSDCCSERTQGFSIYVGDYGPDKIGENKACVTNQPALPAGGPPLQVKCETPIIGKYGSSKILTLCEVMVHGSKVEPTKPVTATDPSKGPDCVMCPVNTWCPGGPKNVQCTAFSSSPPGSTEGSSCLCDSGYHGSYKAGCVKCPAGSYCSGGTADQADVIVSCPANANSPKGSAKLSDCTCNVGYMGSPSTGCSLCPAGSYCPGDGIVIACTANSHSDPGSSALCPCNTGYVKKSDGTCYRCPADHYCPAHNDYVAQECPKNTISPKGSTVPHDCKCLPGYENTAYSNANNWFVVASGTFPQVKQACEDGDGVIASINTNLEMIAARSLCAECWIGFQCDISGNGYTQDNPSSWYWVDGHAVDFTMWQIGEPKKNAATNAIYSGNAIDSTFTQRMPSGNYRGVCKKNNVAPISTQIYSPLSIGMNTGFITDFYYVGHSISDIPSDLIRKSVPNSEYVEDGISFKNDADFEKVDPNIPQDYIAGTWTGMIEIIDAGTYAFSTASDDGSHLYIDGTLVVNNGGLHARTRVEATIPLAKGYHMVKADWFEDGGGANMVVEWKGIDSGNQWEGLPVVHWKRSKESLPDPVSLGMQRGWMVRIWWFNHGLSQFPASETKGNPNQVLRVPQVMFDDAGWAKLGAPADHFAAMLSGMLVIYEAGYYDFWTNSDDGSHLYVDGLMVVNNDGLHPPVKRLGTMHLSHGFHSIMVDFFEDGGGAFLDVSYKGADTDGEEWPIEAFVPPGAPGAPPPLPLVGNAPLAQVDLHPKTGGAGPDMPDDKRGRNSYCSQFANQAQLKTKKAQLKLMAKCMDQDCVQSIEAEVGCQYITPGPGFCYTNPGQKFCKENPSSPDCVQNFQDGGKWTPVTNFPYIKQKDGKEQKDGGLKDLNSKFDCVCAKDCSYQQSSNALRCSQWTLRDGKKWDVDGYDENFVGPREKSPFKRDELNQKMGDKGIFKSGDKKGECACICGEGKQWQSAN